MRFPHLVTSSLLLKSTTSFNSDRNEGGSGGSGEGSGDLNSSGASEINNIDFNIVDSAAQLISNFVTDVQFGQEILSHGCWCAKLSRSNQGNFNLGGKTFTDEVDKICKEWHQARHCSKSCELEREAGVKSGFSERSYFR